MKYLDRLVKGAVIPAILAWTAIASIVILSAIVLWVTFLPGLPGEPGLTLDNYISALTNKYILDLLLNTLLVGIGTTLLVAFFAITIAWLIQRTDIPLKSLLMSLIAITVLVPTFLKAIGWIMLLSPKIGIINELLRNVLSLTVEEGPVSIYGLGGVIFVQGLSLAPSTIFLLSGSLRSVDPAFEEAAQTSGAGRFKTLTKISFPLVWPAILGGVIYISMTAISIYEVPALLGGPQGQVFSTEIFDRVHPMIGLPKFGLAGVYGLMIIVPSILALWFYFRTIAKSHTYQVVTGKGYKPKLVQLGRARYLALAFVLFYLVLAVGLPLLVLLWVSLLPAISMPSIEALSRLSLSQYGRVFGLIISPDVIKNTILMIIAVPLLVVLLSFMVSWVVVRTRLHGRQVMDTIAMLPHAIPGLVFAFSIAVLAIFLNARFDFPLYGSLTIIILASAINRLSYGTRLTNSSLIQVHRELEEAAEISGAGKLSVIRSILIPLVRPSLLFLGMWSALLSVREVTIPLMLSGPRNKVLAVQIWNLWGSGNNAEAAAAGVVLIAIMAILLLLTQRLSGLNVQQ